MSNLFAIQGLLVNAKASFSSKFMIYNGIRVSFGIKFWYPMFDVGQLFIKAFCLKVRIENSKIGCCIRAATGAPLPAGTVTGEISVYQTIPKPPLTVVPVQLQIFDQERGHNHADPIVHAAGLPQFTHACIHNRITRLPGLPSLQESLVGLPWEMIEFRLQVFLLQRREVIQQVVRKLSPNQLFNNMRKIKL